MDDWPKDEHGMFAPEVGSFWVITSSGSPVSGPHPDRQSAQGWLEAWGPHIDLGERLEVAQVVLTSGT